MVELREGLCRKKSFSIEVQVKWNTEYCSDGVHSRTVLRLDSGWKKDSKGPWGEDIAEDGDKNAEEDVRQAENDRNNSVPHVICSIEVFRLIPKGVDDFL